MSSACGDPYLYDYVKIKFKIEVSNRPPNCPAVTWKEYKRQWVVLCTHIAPYQCFLTYCLQEDRWILNKHALPQIKLENFALSKKTSKSTTMTIIFSYFSVKLEFDSISKLQQWAKVLEIIRRRIYTELVRCPDHPEKEKEYVIQLEPDRIIFYNSESEDFSGDIEFEWTISVIKRVKYHNHIGKVEVEVGRSSESGSGVYFFIGFAIKRFFTDIKKRMESHRVGVDTNKSSTHSSDSVSTSKSLTLPSTTRDAPHITSPIDPNRYSMESPPPPPRPPKVSQIDDISPYHTHTPNEDISSYDLLGQYESFGEIDSHITMEVISDTIRRTSEPTVPVSTNEKPRPLPRSRSINARPPLQPTILQRSLTLPHVQEENDIKSACQYQPLTSSTLNDSRDYDPVAVSPNDPIPVLPTVANTFATNVTSFTMANITQREQPPPRPPKPLPKPPPYPPPFSH